MPLPVADPAAWSTLHAAGVDTWRPLVDVLLAGWGLPPAAPERLPGGEDCVAFGVGSDRVVKILAPGSDPGRELELLDQVRLPVATPRVLGSAERGGWSGFLLSRLPGVTLEAAWPEMSEPERLRVLREIGAVMPVLAAVPPPPSTPRPELAARAVDRLGPDAAALLAAVGPLGPPVFLHGDLTDDNTFGERGPDGWRLSGVLDFGGSYVGPALVEVIAPAVFLARAEAPRHAALLAGAGLRPTALQLTAAHLLHPYAQLERDVALLGGAGGSVTAVLQVWSRLAGGQGSG